jgi:hypothetical protein
MSRTRIDPTQVAAAAAKLRRQSRRHDIITDLAAADPRNAAKKCLLCNTANALTVTDHKPRCPWRRAKNVVAGSE